MDFGMFPSHPMHGTSEVITWILTLVPTAEVQKSIGWSVSAFGKDMR